MPHYNTTQCIALLIDAFRTFMKPEVIKEKNILHVETMEGTHVVPCDMYGLPDPPHDCETDSDGEAIGGTFEYMNMLIDKGYIPNCTDPESLCSVSQGYVCRMSAKGYLDCSDWEYCETEADVLRWMEAQHTDHDGAAELPYCKEWDIKARLDFIGAHMENYTLISLEGCPSRIPYGDCHNTVSVPDARKVSTENMYIIVPYAGGSDYSGEAVTAANFDMLADMEGEYPDDICEMYGGYNTYGIAIRLDCASGLWDLVSGLADYPCIDDEGVTAKEMEWTSEAMPEFKADTEREVWQAFPDGGECLDASEETAKRVRTIIAEYCEGSEVEWHYQHSDAWADPRKASAAILRLVDMRQIIDDCYLDTLPSLPDNAPIRYIVTDKAGRVVEETHTGETDHTVIIAWVRFVYSPLHNVDIHSPAVHPLDMEG